jgi:hypothetical protein
MNQRLFGEAQDIKVFIGKPDIPIPILFKHSGEITGGLSALEEAFEALGWEDPHFLSDQEAEIACCEVEDCFEQSSSGMRWRDLYLRLCSNHQVQCFKKKDRPPVKAHAIAREAKRGPDGVLRD